MKFPPHRFLLAGFALAVALVGGLTWGNMARENRSQDAADWVAHTHEVRRWTVIAACTSLALLAVVFSLLLGEDRQRRMVQEIEARLAAIIKSSGDAIISKDLNGTITTWNEGAEKLFGYAADEIVGTSIMRLIPPDRQQEEQDILQKIRSGKSVDHFETLRQTKDGRLLDVSITASPIKDANGAVIGASKVARDITGKKREQNMIDKLSAELETIFSSVPSMIWYKDDQNNILRLNPAAAQSMGRPVAEIEGKSLYDLLPNEAGRYYEDDREVLVSGKPKLKIIERLQSASGEIKWVQTDKVPYRDEKGNVIGIIVISVDITERVQSQDELSRKNAEIELFTNAVSHDLKSPLVTIKTFLGYLEKDLQDPVALAKDLGYIHGAADKMGRLLDDLLALARVGHMPNSPVEVPLQDVVWEARLLVAGQIAERGAQVEVTKDPVILYGDRPRLVELFQNLLDNAVKFMGDQPDPRIEIGAEREGGEIVLFVRDNGKGVDPRHRSKLFGLFEKLDPHTPGSGIGLAMVRRIVEAHGGKIRALSDGPGKGTTFRFTLKKTILLPSTKKPCIL